MRLIISVPLYWISVEKTSFFPILHDLPVFWEFCRKISKNAYLSLASYGIMG